MTETTTDNRPIVPGVADTLAPILAKLPATARAEFTQGRKAAADRAQLTADELAARAAQDQAAEAIRVRRELLADRAERRWAMWCHQVPRHYADPRADCDRRDAKPFEFWLSRLDDMQQPEAIAAWLRGDTPTLVLVGYTGTGKEMPLDTPVLTPGGWVRNGDLAVGDEVVGRDGLPTRVTGVFDNGRRKAWRITFSDGTSIVTGTEHQWSVQTRKLRFSGSGRWQTVTTGEMARRPITRTSGRLHYQWYLPLVEPVEHPKVDLPVDPYALGVLLANGTLRDDDTRGQRRRPRITSNDPYVTDRVAAAYELTNRTYATSTAGQWDLPFAVRDGLVELGCWGHKARTKRIPPAYLTAHVEARMELLQALMDCDGTAPIGRRASYSTFSAGLAEDVATLVRSLGGIAQVKAMNRADGAPERNVAVWLPTNPFGTPLKAERYSPKPWFRAVESIEAIGEDEMRCISVAAPDRLYVTKDYLVTHNTRAAIAAGYAAAAAGVHVRYTSQLDYLRLLRPGGSDDPGRVRWNAANTSLLILDDVGAETEIASEFTRQEVCALLDERMRENRRQIITTNIDDPRVLGDMFGDRIVSRLMGGATALAYEGDDRRLVPASW